MGKRRRIQKKNRRENVATIAKRLSRRLSKSGDALQRLRSTNRLIPLGNLKRSCLQNLFGGWVCAFIRKGRCFTKKLSKEVCRRLRDQLDMDLIVPEDEVTRLQNLLKMARKRRLQKHVAKPKKKPAVAMGSPMDMCDTLPLEDNRLS